MDTITNWIFYVSVLIFVGALMFKGRHYIRKAIANFERRQVEKEAEKERLNRIVREEEAKSRGRTRGEIIERNRYRKWKEEERRRKKILSNFFSS